MNKTFTISFQDNIFQGHCLRRSMRFYFLATTIEDRHGSESSQATLLCVSHPLNLVHSNNQNHIYAYVIWRSKMHVNNSFLNSKKKKNILKDQFKGENMSNLGQILTKQAQCIYRNILNYKFKLDFFVN